MISVGIRNAQWASPGARQQGAALLLSLVILLVLTVLAVSSMQGTTLQERMVAAQRDAQLALEGAEHAVQEAEALLSQANVPSFNNSNGRYTADGDPPSGSELHDPDTWTADAAKTVAANHPQIDGEDFLAEAPRYFIELLPISAVAANSELSLNTGEGYIPSTEVNVTAYRIVGRSTGRTGQSPRIIEAFVFR